MGFSRRSGERTASGETGRCTSVAGLAMIVLAASVTEARAQGAPPPPCSAVEAFAALDFWVGSWTVHVGGEQVGTNRIEPILDGCAVAEHWVDADGSPGQSLFYYLPALGAWKQVWVTPFATAPGGVKEKTLIERLEGGGVRFQGEIPLPNGGSYLDRTTLTPLAGGRVRQHIEVSTDGGATWRSTFDAEYRPVAGDR